MTVSRISGECSGVGVSNRVAEGAESEGCKVGEELGEGNGVGLGNEGSGDNIMATGFMRG